PRHGDIKDSRFLLARLTNLHVLQRLPRQPVDPRVRFEIEPAHTRVARTDADPTRESILSVEPPVELRHHHDRKLQTLRLVYRQDAYSFGRDRHRVDPTRLFERFQTIEEAAQGRPSLRLVRARQIEQLFQTRARMRSPAAPRNR